MFQKVLLSLDRDMKWYLFSNLYAWLLLHLLAFWFDVSQYTFFCPFAFSFFLNSILVLRFESYLQQWINCINFSCLLPTITQHVMLWITNHSEKYEIANTRRQKCNFRYVSVFQARWRLSDSLCALLLRPQCFHASFRYSHEREANIRSAADVQSQLNCLPFSYPFNWLMNRYKPHSFHRANLTQDDFWFMLIPLQAAYLDPQRVTLLELISNKSVTGSTFRYSSSITSV